MDGVHSIPYTVQCSLYNIMVICGILGLYVASWQRFYISLTGEKNVEIPDQRLRHVAKAYIVAVGVSRFLLYCLLCGNVALKDF
ncbi:hypothetical protein Y032_0198g1606 [Ancylostoma ceylanicum]|uniref:Uncharacterized protein n=1 Tax=Ancylostoma ceylanicum TaxID=53326 RepID=A0A016SNZ6_9BILA|nr:hypothetical protein Y032_0198g1606 [Ancylostoma ceylanicum]